MLYEHSDFEFLNVAGFKLFENIWFQSVPSKVFSRNFRAENVIELLAAYTPYDSKLLSKKRPSCRVAMNSK